MLRPLFWLFALLPLLGAAGLLAGCARPHATPALFAPADPTNTVDR